MKKGERVEVYYDPLTEQELEGKAQLVEEMAGSIGTWEGRNLALWKVKFSDGAKVTRKILEPLNG